MRTGLFCGLATIVVAASATPAQAEQQTYNFELRTQDIGSALRAIASITKSQVIFDGDEVRGKRSRAVKGSYSTEDALDLALRGTGLVAQPLSLIHI